MCKPQVLQRAARAAGRSLRRWTPVGLMLAGALACRPDPEPQSAEGAGLLRVYVSIPPQRYFAQRVGGDHVEVYTLLAPGQSPHLFEPTPQVIGRIAGSDVFFKIGMPFETQVVDKLGASMKNLRIVDTSAGIERMTSVACDHADHDGAHDHAGDGADELDPHVWMDPQLVIVLAASMRDEFSRLDPIHAEEYAANHAAFAAELVALDKQIAADLAPVKGQAFFIFHPACGYFAQRYGLHQVAIESEGKAPHAKQLAALIERARAAGVKLIFVQPQFDSGNAAVIAKAIDGAVAPLDPLAENYVENLRQMAALIRDALMPAPTTVPVG